MIKYLIINLNLFLKE